MDYRKFLGQAQKEEVLPYFGGPRVDALERSLRVTREVEAGWWRFSIQGRKAEPKEKADPPDLSKLPSVRGHLWGTRLVRDGAIAETVHFFPEEEPAQLSPCVARRWPSGVLLFDRIEFEGEVEMQVRNALEEGRALAEIKGVPASLRAAFGYATIEATSQRLNIPAAAAEVRPRIGEVAQGGTAAAESVLRQLVVERQAYAQELARRQARMQQAQTQAQVQAQVQAHVQAQQASVNVANVLDRRGNDRARDRIEAALDGTGASLRSTRMLGSNRMEVAYTFMDERFITVVDANTLQVLDAGLCLAGADQMVTLESLPSVIREAIDTGKLVITRHGYE
jgi:hypothetical protein